MAEFVKVYTSEDMKPENIGKNPLTFVDFWATWCGPCRMMAPIVEELASETPDVVFAKVDVDENPDIAQRYGIMSIPTFIVFKGGEPSAQTLGARPKDQILAML